MEKKDLKGYLEFFSKPTENIKKIDLTQLIKAADESQIHTFGWPIGVVLHNEFKPKPYSHHGIRSVFDRDEMFDYWTLDSNGEYYILMSLFEDRKSENVIFIDTRTVRATELLLRTANLYKLLGVSQNTLIELKIEYGGLEGRVLKAANPNRVMFDRTCSVDVINISFQEPLLNFFDNEHLKKMVFLIVKNITEMCELFIPSKEAVIDPIVEAFSNGRIH